MFFVVICLFFLSSAVTDRVEIINGNNAIDGQFPWQVSVWSVRDNLDINFCSGAIISDHWVLTAAHCVVGYKAVIIYSGTRDIASADRVETYASKLIAHENFNSTNYMYNIALARLEIGLNFDNFTKSILLDDQGLDAGVEVTISGWGATDDNPDNLTQFLQYAKVTTISNEDCASIYGSQQITDELICAIGEEPLRNPCENEAGAPLVLDADSENPKHVGIFSFMNGYGCTANYPAGYVRTASFRDWIKENSGV